MKKKGQVIMGQSKGEQLCIHPRALVVSKEMKKQITWESDPVTDVQLIPHNQGLVFQSKTELQNFLSAVDACKRGMCPCLSFDKIRVLFDKYGHSEVGGEEEWNNIQGRLHTFALEDDPGQWAYNRLDSSVLRKDVMIVLRAFHYERCRLNLGIDEARQCWKRVAENFPLQVMTSEDRALMLSFNRLQQDVSILNLFFKTTI